MESLTFHLRRGDETIESWDDDGDLQCYEDIQLRTASSATSVTNSSIRRSGHRDSISSRRSARSDLDSTAGDDEDWQVQLLDNEEAVNEEAIASAKSAGIPLPANVPKSALVGGTIKRLGPRKTKHKFVDDWSDDVEFPGPDTVLELKSPQAVSFPESLQQISSAAASPVKTSASPFWSDDIALRLQSSSSTHIDMYREDEAADADDIPTIKPAKLRSPQRASVLNQTMPGKESSMADAPEDNFEEDFDLPPDNSIRLSPLKATAGTQCPSPEDFDMEWSEGSIGVRVGGTARDHRSNPSSSISVVSPSASSCLTAESDEGLDGLVIPEGPLDLTMSMQKRVGPSTAAMETPDVKSYRHTRRANSDSSQEAVASQSQVSRLPRPGRYEALGHNTSDSGTQVTAAKRTLTRPTRRRNFGDGTELASFDDLPTSSTAESKFVKHPSGRGAPRSLKNKLGRSQTIPSRTDVPQPVLGTPTPARRYDQTPRFARDTNASRNAREQRIASMTSGSKCRENSALVSLSSNWNAQTISRVPTTPLSIRSKKSRTATISGSKPHLIKPLGTGVQERKSVNGMRYNPATFRWEGNESLAQDFDTDSPQSPKPAPALITNVGAMQNVQVVGGMVFDPQRMCWLKLAPLQPGTKGLVAVQDEDDVFAGLGNLEEKSGSMPPPSGVNDDLGHVVSGDDRSCGDSSDEWPITEEFDVGPEFIRRQRAEEEKWRRKVNKWTDFDRMKFGDSWRWAIRDLVGFNSTLSVQGLGGN
ncbi:hypothetical protein N8T08_008324 [Aspergillus melleus]|uniref:Uncharacterized protein n=1 Tax=Aspergillus melleus TaxID=138277 RepID=A0ACC3AVS8_9EURO|nr:hypothetical protein N8T08_008324 [Aspergillus melleus]